MTAEKITGKVWRSSEKKLYDEDDKKDALIQGLLYTYPQARVYGHRDFDSRKACPCFDARAEYV